MTEVDVSSDEEFQDDEIIDSIIQADLYSIYDDSDADDLEHLLSCMENNFDIIGVTETRITEQISLNNRILIWNYCYKFTPTKTTAGENIREYP